MSAHTSENHVYGGIVLCGGMSRRMGRAKAELPFGDESMLQRVIGRLSAVVSPIVVVAADSQPLPHLPKSVIVARDVLEKAGPLAGISAGMHKVPSSIEAVYVTSCDVPFLSPEFVRFVLAQLTDYDVAIPTDDDYVHPLAAAYRTNLRPRIEQLLKANCRRPRDLLEQVRTNRIPTSQLRSVDANLDTLVNLNRPADYKAALERENLPLPTWLIDFQDPSPSR